MDVHLYTILTAITWPLTETSFFIGEVFTSGTGRKVAAGGLMMSLAAVSLASGTSNDPVFDTLVFFPTTT